MKLMAFDLLFIHVDISMAKDVEKLMGLPSKRFGKQTTQTFSKAHLKHRKIGTATCIDSERGSKSFATLCQT